MMNPTITLLLLMSLASVSNALGPLSSFNPAWAGTALRVRDTAIDRKLASSTLVLLIGMESLLGYLATHPIHRLGRCQGLLWPNCLLEAAFRGLEEPKAQRAEIASLSNLKRWPSAMACP